MISQLLVPLIVFFLRWYSKCVLQHKGQELMDGLKMAFTGKLLFLSWTHIWPKIFTFMTDNSFFSFTGALKDYLKFNNCLPSRIIVYRDGVGDGQLHSVVNFEISQILESIKSLGQDYKWVFLQHCFMQLKYNPYVLQNVSRNQWLWNKGLLLL